MAAGFFSPATWFGFGRANNADVLQADDVESASDVSSPAIGQVHALLANDVQSASNVSAPSIGQVHALLANDVESVSQVSAPALAETSEDALLANDIESATEVSTPTLTIVVAPVEVEAPELGGGRIVATTKADNRSTATQFSRERYRALRAAMAAEERAKEHARSFRRKKDRKIAGEAVREVADVLEAARRNADDIAEVSELRAVADLLRGAAQATAIAAFLAQVEAARIALGRALEDQARMAAEAALRAEEEDEDEAMALLLAA